MELEFLEYCWIVLEKKLAWGLYEPWYCDSKVHSCTYTCMVVYIASHLSVTTVIYKCGWSVFFTVSYDEQSFCGLITTSIRSSLICRLVQNVYMYFLTVKTLKHISCGDLPSQEWAIILQQWTELRETVP